MNEVPEASSRRAVGDRERCCHQGSPIDDAISRNAPAEEESAPPSSSNDRATRTAAQPSPRQNECPFHQGQNQPGTPSIRPLTKVLCKVTMESPSGPLKLSTSQSNAAGSSGHLLPSPIIAITSRQVDRLAPTQNSTAISPPESPSIPFRHPNDPLPIEASGSIVDTNRLHVQGNGEGSDHSSRRRTLLCCFLPCRLRPQLLQCLASGLLLSMVLAICEFPTRGIKHPVSILLTRRYCVVDLGLALTHHIARGELTIIIIMVIAFATMFFFSTIIRLCMVIHGSDGRRGMQCSEMAGMRGYVVPPKPIPVLLARDEEATGIEGEVAKLKPPAYGLWRNSFVSSLP